MRTPDTAASDAPLDMGDMQIPRINNPHLFKTLARRLGLGTEDSPESAEHIPPQDNAAMRSHDAPNLFDALAETGDFDIYHADEDTPHTDDTTPNNDPVMRSHDAPNLFDALAETGDFDIYHADDDTPHTDDDTTPNNDPVMRSHEPPDDQSPASDDNDTSALVNAFRSFADMFNKNKQDNGGDEPPQHTPPPRQPPAPPSNERSIQRHSPPEEHVSSAPPPAYPAYGEVVQRAETDSNSNIEDDEMIDLDQLARDVFQEIRHRLRIERERRHRR
jgi:hypothetical protein